MGLDLAAQIDLDARLARDRALGVGELATRDERLGDGLAGTSPAARLSAWLDRVYAGTPRPGDRFVTVQRRVRAVVWLAGLLLGTAAAAALLHYDGTMPINVVNVLAGLVGLQLAILAVLLVHLGVARGQPMLHEGMRRWLGLERFVVLDPAAERWLVVRLTQGFGIAFNAGALLAMWYLVSFTDLAFAWSTTLGVEPEVFRRATHALCAPFSWIAPAVCPDDAVVAATQYFRQGARYAGGAKPDPAIVGAWWPFLVGCVAFYGLLPRLTLWVVAQVRVRQAIARPRLDALEVQALLGRLVPRPKSQASPEVASPAQQALPRFSEAVVAIAWRDLSWDEARLRDDIRSRFGASVLQVRRAGSIHGDLDGAESGKSAGGGLLVYADLTSDFDKATARFVSGLRATVGPRTPIVLVPVETRTDIPADSQKLALWRTAVARTGDPYLGVA